MIFQKSNPVLTISFEEFKNGLWTSLPLAGIPLGAASISQNVDYSRGNGRIIKRAGIQTFESIPLYGNRLIIGVITMVSAPNTCTITTTTNHGLATGTTVFIENLSPNLFSLNGTTWTITNVDATHFKLNGGGQGIDSAGAPTNGSIMVGGASSTITDNFSNLYQFIQSPAGGGASFDVASNSNNVMVFNSAFPYGAKYVAFSGPGTLSAPNWTTFSDLLLQVSPTEPTVKWNGSTNTMATLLGTPPSNGKYICVWQNRVFIANTSAGASRLHYSNSGLPEDWTTAGAAGFIDVNANDGDVITGIMPLGNYLYIFKNRTVHQLSGISPSTFSVIPFITSRGCVAPKSIISMGQYIVYLSQYGVHSVGQYVDGFMSEAIRYDIQNLLSRPTTCAGKVRDLYVLSYDINGDGVNETAFVLDNRTGAWTQYTNVKANAFLQKSDGNLYSAGNDSQIIRVHDSGEDDNGVAIPMQWRSGMMGFDDFTAVKEIYDVWFDAKPIAGKHLTVNTIVDGIQVDSNTQPIDPFNGQAIKSFGLDSVPNAYGRFLQLEFVNAELAAPIEVNQFSTAAILMPRQQLPS